ncbi:MAG: hypothetical protein AAFO07_01515 [Bacteroidota bacterium]
MSPKQSLFKLLIAMLTFTLLLSSCQEEGEIIDQILINNNEGEFINQEFDIPLDEIANMNYDSNLKVVIVELHQKVRFSIQTKEQYDQADIKEEVRWDVDGKQGLDAKYVGLKNIRHVYETTGLKLVNLILGDVVKRKYVYVKNPAYLSKIKIIEPAKNQMHIKENAIEVDLDLDVNSIDEVSMELNGRPISNISLDDQGYLYKKVTGLKKGKNIIFIGVESEDGSTLESKTITVFYDGPEKREKRKPVLAKNDSPTSKGQTRKAGIGKKASVALSEKNHAVASECATFKDESFLAVLSPKSDLQLESFTIFTNNCGAINITVSGADINTTFKKGLTAGRSSIQLSDQNLKLKRGNSYTITGVAESMGSACPDVPKFENISDCRALENLFSKMMDFNNKGKQIVYDLKFIY